jgi:regulator of protease activity HflC (stomatin/prohibitin superfamily)
MIVDTGRETIRETAAKAAPTRSRASAAIREHATKGFLTLAILALVIAYLAPYMFITIQSGQVGVLYLRFLGGTQTDRVLGEGMKIIPPWDKIFIYTVRIQEDRHEMPVLTTEGMTVKLHLSIRYHPEPDLVGLLQQRVGPEYKERVVIPEVESALRTIMGRFSMHDVYGSERGLVQTAINDSLDHVEQNFVKVDSIVLREVELPAKVRDAVEEKMTQQELDEAYEFRLAREKKEADRKRIEAQGLKDYNDTINASLTPNLLKWRGIEATKELAASPNAKTVILGNTAASLPLMLSGDK